MIVNRRTRRWATAVMAALAIASVAGCSGYNNARGKGDAPVGTSDDSPAQILFVPTHAKTDPPITVIDDASCPGGATR